MSKYTTMLRYVCETYAGETISRGEASIDEIIQLAIPHIFDFTFPIYDENHRNELETKIIMHYYMYEIGAETVGLWKMFLKTTLNEIMPYYNELYKSAELLNNPLDDVDYKRTIEGSGNETKTEKNVSTQNTNGSYEDNVIESNNSKTVGKYSDTPQGGLNGLEEDRYMSEANITNNEGNRTNNSNGTTEQTTNGTFNTDGTTQNDHFTTENVKGKMYSGSKAKITMEYRRAILNVDMMIINELRDLFMLIY